MRVGLFVVLLHLSHGFGAVGSRYTPSLSATVEQEPSLCCLEDGGDQDPEAEYSDCAEESDAEQQRRQVVARAALLAKGSPLNRRGTAPNTSVGARRIGSASRGRQGATRTSKLLETVRHAARGMAKEQPKQPLSPEALQQAIDNVLVQSGVEPYLKPQYLKTTGSSQILLRLATPADDVSIASLRLSVFTNFTAVQRDEFCDRSVQAIQRRRQWGAFGVVACQDDRIVGAAECSFHEFLDTRLGHGRPVWACRYIREVAVHPNVRQQGIGTALLQCMEQACNAETLYLHVDVGNEAALRLYQRTGFAMVDTDAAQDFTTALQLHPEATHGKRHWLLSKDLVAAPTVLPERTLGIQVPQ